MIKTTGGLHITISLLLLELHEALISKNTHNVFLAHVSGTGHI